MNKHLIILLLLSLSCMCAKGQQYTNDTKLKLLVKAAKEQTDDAAYIKGMLQADSFAKAEKMTLGRAEVNNTLGAYFYSTDVDKSLMYLQKAYDLYIEGGKKSNAAYCMENMAFAYQEQKKDIPMAMKYTQQAITNRAEMKDTFGLANMSKYAATLYGKLGKYKEGKKSADTAIKLYAMKGNQLGVAVSYRDLADVYNSEGRADSAIFFYLKAKDIWQEAKGERSRIYEWNNDLIDIYVKDRELPKAEALYRENDTTSIKIYYTNKLHFYKSSTALFKRSKDKEMMKVYKAKYENFSDSLKKAGKIVN